MTVNARRELFEALKPLYIKAAWSEKRLLLDGFVTATGYNRKHAIALLNSEAKQPKARTRRPKYGPQVVQALITLWKAANRICSRRLIPFLPTLIESLERFGHVHLDLEVKQLLLSLSPATMDRLLKPERKKYGKRKSTTKPGYLLKKHIPIRTYSDWNDLRPGFLEIDLVAHGGESASGQFLHTLTMTDIASTWTECYALIGKSEAGVLAALDEAQKILPFSILGIDSDNGSEFINHGLLDWCRAQQVTFTRSREYKKNDQAHVEEKNGSIVRRLVGYGRFEGHDSWRRLQNIYIQSRLYINFFQPSLKLADKDRDGGRVRRRYETARTPYERLIQNKEVKNKSKLDLTEQFKRLDPVALLEQIEMLQNDFWATAVSPGRQAPQTTIQSEEATATKTATKATPVAKRPRYQPRDQKPFFSVYPGQKKGRKTNLDEVWPEVCQLLEANPTISPHQVEMHLTEQYPGRFRSTQANTIRDKVLRWRDEHGIETVYQKGKPGRKSNIDFIWEAALPELERDPLLSRRKLLALMMEKLPGQVKQSQLSCLASRLKQWRIDNHPRWQTGSSEIKITIIESAETLPVIPERENQ